jgi:type II secretory pathway pseudopilin PulG
MRRRQAFTIVELLVSLALILFIMVILTEAFSAGTETFRQLKAVGDMQERLRTLTTLLRRDLAADHFEGHRRLGDPTFWQDGFPVLGYFRFDGGGSYVEGSDPDLAPGVSPVRCPPPPANGQLQFAGQAAPGGHVLAFTVRLRGNSRENFFSAALPPPPLPPSPLLTLDTTFYGYSLTPDVQFQDSPNTYNSQWAEVVYFLVWNGTYAGTTPLYSLYRSQLAVVPDNRTLTGAVPSSLLMASPYYYSEMSCYASGPFLAFSSPGDLTNPGNRAFPNRPQFTALNNPTNSSQWGATLLLADVVSFDVRVVPYLTGSSSLFPSFSDFATVNGTPQVGTTAWNNGFAFDTADPAYYSNNPNYFNNPGAPLPGYVVKALQISIRVWDLKTQQTRQTSVIQDL